MKSAVSTSLILSAIVACACQSNAPRTEHVTYVEPEPSTSIDTPDSLQPCPPDMITIEGDYCPNAREVCLQWVSREGKAIPEAVPKDGNSGRCGTFKFPSECLSKEKVHKRYCIDRYEYPNVAGQKPESWMSYYDVKKACEAQGKRLCEKEEWTFACEGPNMQPLPYGDGYHRDSSACNIDNPIPSEIRNILKVKERTSKEGKILDGLLIPAGSKPSCASPFGVYDMVGNIDEFIHYGPGHASHGDPDDHGPFISGLVSGHVFGVRNACRPVTAGHNEYFAWYETGGRCCADAK